MKQFLLKKKINKKILYGEKYDKLVTRKTQKYEYYCLMEIMNKNQHEIHIFIYLCSTSFISYSI